MPLYIAISRTCTMRAMHSTLIFFSFHRCLSIHSKLHWCWKQLWILFRLFHRFIRASQLIQGLLTRSYNIDVPYCFNHWPHYFIQLKSEKQRKLSIIYCDWEFAFQNAFHDACVWRQKWNINLIETMLLS